MEGNDVGLLETTPTKKNISDSDEDNLRIVLTPNLPPNRKKRTARSKIQLDTNDKQIIEAVETEMEEILEEKAAKNNLKPTDVKKILKQVVTNEHVLAMVLQEDNPKGKCDAVYEPKLTRSKAK